VLGRKEESSGSLETFRKIDKAGLLLKEHGMEKMLKNNHKKIAWGKTGSPQDREQYEDRQLVGEVG